MATYKTITDIINRDDRFDINKISFFTQTENGELIIQDTDLFSIYMRFINQFIVTYKVTQDEVDRYKFKPHLLSYDIYGTPSLAWLILRINDKECPSKFYLKDTIKLIPMTALKAVYDNVITKSSERLEKNQRTYLKLVGDEI